MKKMKKMFLAFSVTVLLCSMLPVSALGAEGKPVGIRTASESITPYSYEYEWLYKVEDGQLYKRLYNKTTGRWVGDWIPAN